MVSDSELLLAWSTGDRVAGNQLFQRHFAPVYRFFVNKVDQAAEDLVQQTFLRLLEGVQRFAGRSSFRTYVFGVAHNVLREHFRRGKARRTEAYDELSVADLGGRPSSIAAARQEVRLLLEGLRRTPLAQQVLLELYYFEGLTGPELGEFLQVAEDTARSRVRSALASLRAAVTSIPEASGADALLREIDAWMASLREAVEEHRRSTTQSATLVTPGQGP